MSAATQTRRFDGRYDRVVDYEEMGQLALPIVPLAELEAVQGHTIQEAFEAFHEANPWVYECFVILTRDWIDRGRTRVGIGMLTEILRWEYGRRTRGSEFKLNNNFRSRYSRLLIDNHPEFASVFHTRALRAV